MSEEGGDVIGKWILDRLALVVGKDGKGGSGTCIRVADGSIAVLTARHVVLDCILTGALMVGRPSKESSVTPRRIRVASRSDVAHLVIDESEFQGDALSFSEWTRPVPEIPDGKPVLAAGFVGEWKKVDIAAGRIDSVKALLLGTKTTQWREGQIACDVDETKEGLPATFQGMSGGPLFTPNREFLGVTVEESRRIGASSRGAIYAVPVEDLKELHVPFQPPSDAPADYIRQEAWAPILDIVNQGTGRQARMRIDAELFWSKDSPDAEFGRCGRITAFRFLDPPGAERLIVNTEAIFMWYEDTEDARMQALDEEVRFFLLRTGWALAAPPSAPTSPKSPGSGGI